MRIERSERSEGAKYRIRGHFGVEKSKVLVGAWKWR
jgi:hypothetical protein